MPKFGGVSLMIVDPDTRTASNCGFAEDCLKLLKFSFPDLPCSTYLREDIQKMIREVDYETGGLYIIDPSEGIPLLANSTGEKVLEEYEGLQGTQGTE